MATIFGKKNKNIEDIDLAIANKKSSINSKQEKPLEVVHTPTRRHFSDDKKVEHTKSQIEDKKAKMVNVKNAQKTKKNSFGSWLSDISRNVPFGHMNEENEDIALLCDQMRFDAKEAYKLLRTNVMFCLPDNSVCRTIGITSAIRGEGKSTVSINLAYTFAVTGARVLLIDMDMRLPSIAKKLKIENKLGLSDYLIGNATLRDVIKQTDKYTNWDIMFSGSIPPAPSELIGSDAMERLINRLEKEYDFIIIDLPPVNIVSDALVAKDILDGYIITVRQDYSDKHSLADCMRQLAFLDANILGFVMTDANSGSHYYRKYGKKYYKRKYYSNYYKRKYGYYRKYGYDKKYANDAYKGQNK